MVNVLKYLLFFFNVPIFLCQWQTLQTLLQSNLSDVSIPASNIVWAIPFNDTSMVRSTNGGRNWLNITKPLLQTYHVCAINKDTVWITGGNPTGRLFKSSNAGTNWIEQTFYPQNYINNIYFFNANTGIFLTDQTSGIYGFFITRNGGNTWYRSANSPTGNTVLTDNRMGVLDTNLVWFVLYTTEGYRLLKLTGGLDNVWVSIPFLNNSSMTNVLFKDAITALATDGRQIHISTNGGLNWSVRNDSALNIPGNMIVESFINVGSSEWVFIKAGNKVRISYDFCITWQPTQTINDAVSGFMRAYDSNSIYIAGQFGKIFKYNFNFIRVKKISYIIPEKFSLKQNYPNPFNPNTVIRFSLSVAIMTNLIVYDILGREVVMLVDDELNPGTYEVDFDGAKYPSGVYYYKLFAGDFTETRKMVLIK